MYYLKMGWGKWIETLNTVVGDGEEKGKTKVEKFKFRPQISMNYSSWC